MGDLRIASIAQSPLRRGFLRERLLAQIERNGNPRAFAPVRKNHVRHIAGKKHHQSSLWVNINTVGHTEKSRTAGWVGVPQMQCRSAVRITSIAGIHIVSARPGGYGVYVHFVEGAAAVHVRPGFPQSTGLQMVPAENPRARALSLRSRTRWHSSGVVGPPHRKIPVAPFRNATHPGWIWRYPGARIHAQESFPSVSN